MTEKSSWALGALSEANINTYLRHTGDGWNNDTGPRVYQGFVDVPITIQRTVWYRSGRLIIGDYRLFINGAGLAGGILQVKLPFSMKSAGGVPPFMPIGRGVLLDSSANTFFQFLVITRNSDDLYCELRGTGPLGAVNGARLGSSPSNFTAALATNDLIRFTFCYEAAA
jgi:hypothetical protein